MGSIAQKLARVLLTKEQIRQAILSKGVAIAETVPFSEYGNKIRSIQSNNNNNQPEQPECDGMKIRFRASHSKHNAAAAAVVESYMAIRAAVE